MRGNLFFKSTLDSQYHSLSILMYGNLCLFNCDVMRLINSPQLVKQSLKHFNSFRWFGQISFEIP